MASSASNSTLKTVSDSVEGIAAVVVSMSSSEQRSSKSSSVASSTKRRLMEAKLAAAATAEAAAKAAAATAALRLELVQLDEEEEEMARQEVISSTSSPGPSSPSPSRQLMNLSSPRQMQFSSSPSHRQQSSSPRQQLPQQPRTPSPRIQRQICLGDHHRFRCQFCRTLTAVCAVIHRPISTTSTPRGSSSSLARAPTLMIGTRIGIPAQIASFTDSCRAQKIRNHSEATATTLLLRESPRQGKRCGDEILTWMAIRTFQAVVRRR
jgi:hypothetical protein